MSIEYKSTGSLIDEMITTLLKTTKTTKNKEENERRWNLLSDAISKRFEKSPVPIYDERVVDLWQELSETLEACWDAQETVMEFTKPLDCDAAMWVGNAAIDAQDLNAKRNRLIRELDELLGESDYTQLEKSYDRGDK